jgi:hypothetical protein
VHGKMNHSIGWKTAKEALFARLQSPGTIVKGNSMKISAFTAIFSVYLIVSSSFMRYVQLNIEQLFRNIHIRLENFILALFLLAAIVFIIFIIIKKLYVSVVPSAMIITAIIAYTRTMDIIAERIHLLQFAALGFLIAFDNIRFDKKRGLLYALLWCFLVPVIDEVFQYFLPSRVGDYRDVFFGFIGGVGGILLYFSVYFKDFLVKRKNP